MPLFHLCTVFISLSLFTSSTLSRTFSSPPTTTLLDVSSSLQQTLHVLSFNPQNLDTTFSQEQQTFASLTSNSTSSFSLQLHPRDSLYKIQYKDYHSLLLSRLERDSSRVGSINTKLQLSLIGINRSDLKPLHVDIRPEELSTPVTSGISQGSGEYFTRLSVGSPPKPMYLAIDTGSDVNWLQCMPCTDCYQQSDPIFDPSQSSTYRPLTCESQQCRSLDVSACRTDRCLYQVSYGDGSFTVGEFITETVTLGNSGAVKNVALGCGRDNEGLFVGSAGLLGLGGGPLSLTSQIKASSFSYCLVNRDSSGSSTLEFNSGRPGDSVTAPLTRNSKIDTFYYVGLSGFNVGGQKVSIPPSIFQMDESGKSGVIVDCGTAVTRLQTQAYNSLRDSFVKLTPDLKRTNGVALFDTCYDFSSLRSVKVPTVSFVFSGGQSLSLPPKNYLLPVDSAGTFCFAFAPTTSSLSIIGNVQQQGTRVSFDLANNRVGFSSNKC
ncbi:Asp domain-containing protein [Cephalotus follicularis]|uniref:Asp domain-containing protein n=1 Tax=Cephalotus follicularis TaxID=3775 RepID=A0A1Q3D3I8_CEPFO|nr:Asp domain-containing protein [Cephalotus follicularis]